MSWYIVFRIVGDHYENSLKCVTVRYICFWTGAMIGLPESFMHRNENGKGGGVLQVNNSFYSS